MFKEQAQRINAGLSGGGTDMRFQFLEGTADLRPFIPVTCQVFLTPDADGLCPGSKFQQSGIGLFREVAGMEQFGLVRLQAVAFQLFIPQEEDGERKQDDQHEVSYEYFEP